MKRTKKVKICSLLLCILIAFAAILESPIRVQAAAKIPADHPGIFSYDGKYIYYAATDFGGKGITRYDPKTNKKKVILSWEKFNRKSMIDLCVKGDYIYFLANNAKDRYGLSYGLYRVKKDGSKLKNLKVYTHDFVIVGNMIYYVEDKIVKGVGYEGKDDSTSFSTTQKLMKVKLDGSGKKKVKEFDYVPHIAIYNNKLIVSSDSSTNNYQTISGKEIDIATIAPLGKDSDICNPFSWSDVKAYADGYEYFWDSDTGNFCRQKEEGKVTKVLSAEKHIMRYRICGNYIMHLTMENGQYKISCMKTNVKGRKTLSSVYAAG